MDLDKAEALDSLAEHLERDRSYVLNEAVEHYLDLNEYHVRLIEKGIAAAKAGKFVEHDEVKKMVRKMGRKK
jgi:predicted transcriptional regulator